MMKTLSKTFSGFMVLALTLVIAGCTAGKSSISTKSVCEAYDKFGAQKLDEFDDLKRIIGSRSIEAEGGSYYTTQDEDETEFIVKNIIFRFEDIPDWDCQECTYFIATSKEDGSMTGSYIMIMENEKDAIDLFNFVSEDFSYNDNYASGSKSGVDYAVYNEEGNKIEMEGVYRQGNSVFGMKTFADETKGIKDSESIIKNLGLVSPLSK